MKSFALASGSSGNCFYVESFSGKKILVDCGLSFNRTQEILKERDIDIFDIEEIFITHEHSDHVLGIKTFLNKLKCNFYMSKGTLNSLNVFSDKIEIVKNHDSLLFNDLRVFAVKKPHDAKEALSYIFESKGIKLGIFTDLGHVTDEIKHILKTLDIIYIEANYCEDHIKENCKDLSMNYLNRLMSDLGHLSINQTCETLIETVNDFQKIVLSHISENTNYYENSYTKIKSALEKVNKNPQLYVSFQGEPTDWI